MTKSEALDLLREKYGEQIYPSNHCCHGESESIAAEIYAIIEQIETE